MLYRRLRVTPSRPRRESCQSIYKKSNFVRSSHHIWARGSHELLAIRRSNQSTLHTPPHALGAHLEIGIILPQRRQLALRIQIRIDELISPIPLTSLLFARIRPQRRDIRIALDVAIPLQIRQRLIQERLDVFRATISLEIVDPDFLPVRERSSVIDRTFELRETRCSLGSGVVPMNADHINRTPCLAAQIEELSEPIQVFARLQHRGTTELHVLRVGLHKLHIKIHGLLRLQMIAAIGLWFPKAQERLCALGNRLLCIGVPFRLLAADAVVLRHELLGRVPFGRWGGVPVCDPADVGLRGVGEGDVALVVGLWVSACGGDDAAFAGAAACTAASGVRALRGGAG